MSSLPWSWNTFFASDAQETQQPAYVKSQESYLQDYIDAVGAYDEDDSGTLWTDDGTDSDETDEYTIEEVGAFDQDSDGPLDESDYIGLESKESRPRPAPQRAQPKGQKIVLHRPRVEGRNADTNGVAASTKKSLACFIPASLPRPPSICDDEYEMYDLPRPPSLVYEYRIVASTL